MAATFPVLLLLFALCPDFTDDVCPNGGASVDATFPTLMLLFSLCRDCIDDVCTAGGALLAAPLAALPLWRRRFWCTAAATPMISVKPMATAEPMISGRLRCADAARASSIASSLRAATVVAADVIAVTPGGVPVVSAFSGGPVLTELGC